MPGSRYPDILAAQHPGILASWHTCSSSQRGHQSGLSSARNFPTTRADNDKRQVAGESLFSSRGGSDSQSLIWSSTRRGISTSSQLAPTLEVPGVFSVLQEQILTGLAVEALCLPNFDFLRLTVDICSCKLYGKRYELKWLSNEF